MGSVMQDLMYDANSPILDFYPTDFQQDLNGKKQEWEAVVKIPFINQERLLKAMACTLRLPIVMHRNFEFTCCYDLAREHRLTPKEKKRNSFGTSTKFSYAPDGETMYPSSLPGFFPDLPRCMCRMEDFNLPTLDGLHFIEGLCEGVSLGAEALAGFPSLKTLRHTGQLGYHGVHVHGSETRNPWSSTSRIHTKTRRPLT
jgi:5'-3' exoribonuclease 1